MRACAFYAARQEASALLYAARSMHGFVHALRETDRASLAAWLAAEDAQGWACLHWAAHSARLRMVQALLALGADPDQLGTVRCVRLHASRGWLAGSSFDGPTPPPLIAGRARTSGTAAPHAGR